MGCFGTDKRKFYECRVNLLARHGCLAISLLPRYHSLGMDIDQINALSTLGHAIWPETSRAKTLETWSAIQGLELPPESALERASQAMLHRATHETIGLQPGHPFFQLALTPRALLAMLHRNRWSYDRIARVLKLTRDDVGRMAWYARLSLAASLGDGDAYPTGSSFKGARCPPYDASNPWTQHFMDEEVETAERLFLQNHMMACSTCRNALHRCREMIYRVDQALPQNAPDMREDIKRAYWLRPTDGITLRDALLRFVDRPETRRWGWVLLGFFVLGFLFLRA